MQKNNNKINPAHYQGENGRQCIDIMLERYGIDAVIHFCQLNSFKYHFRAGRKEGESKETDLDKARWYEDKARELAMYRSQIH